MLRSPLRVPVQHRPEVHQALSTMGPSGRLGRQETSIVLMQPVAASVPVSARTSACAGWRTTPSGDAVTCRRSRRRASAKSTGVGACARWCGGWNAVSLAGRGRVPDLQPSTRLGHIVAHLPSGAPRSLHRRFPVERNDPSPREAMGQERRDRHGPQSPMARGSRVGRFRAMPASNSPRSR